MPEYTQYFIQILLSILLGLFIGFEREQQKKPAGIRDVAIVTLGACLFTIISLEMAIVANQFQQPIRYDIGRIIAYTIVSMGFLGSGAIMRTQDKMEGITTAGVLWIMVSVGILCGLGKYVLAGVSTLSVYCILKLNYFKVKIEPRHVKRKKKIKKSLDNRATGALHYEK